MQFVAPDIVADLCGLSLGVLLTGAALGLVLWLLGWWSHRFWIVLAATVLAGVYGLQHAAELRTHPLLAAVLLAIAAGILALPLVRLLAFALGGLAGLALIQSALPSLDQPLVGFVACGLTSLLLFRWFMMVATSFLGASLLCHAGLALLHTQGLIDAALWCEHNGTLANWMVALTATMGFACQFLLSRRSRRDADEAAADEDPTLFSFARFYRRAG